MDRAWVTSLENRILCEKDLHESELESVRVGVYVLHGGEVVAKKELDPIRVTESRLSSLQLKKLVTDCAVIDGRRTNLRTIGFLSSDVDHEGILAGEEPLVTCIAVRLAEDLIVKPSLPMFHNLQSLILVVEAVQSRATRRRNRERCARTTRRNRPHALKANASTGSDA